MQFFHIRLQLILQMIKSVKLARDYFDCQKIHSLSKISLKHSFQKNENKLLNNGEQQNIKNIFQVQNLNENQKISVPKNVFSHQTLGNFFLQSYQKQTLKFNIQNMKIQIKNALMRMSYTQKLEHIEALAEEAHHLSLKYGYFYVTCAMITFDPCNQIKLSIWIHPNLKSQKCLHPIIKRTEKESEAQFYTSLKNTLFQLFPTISLGNGTNYISINFHIRSLKKKIQKRLHKSFSQTRIKQLSKASEQVQKSKIVFQKQQNKKLTISLLDNFYDQKAIIYEEDEQNQVTTVLGKKTPRQKQISPSSTIESKETQSIICFKKNEMVRGQVEDFQENEQNYTLYYEDEVADSVRNQILKSVSEEFLNILF